MNIEKMEQLAKWLEQGAPHVAFNMNYGMTTYQRFLGNIPDDDVEEMVTIQKNQKGLGDCGTVCCIAGYADYLDGGRGVVSWSETRENALKALGLEADGNYGTMGHPLFDPSLAPENCTPQQAAVAVRRMMAGEYPWPDED